MFVKKIASIFLINISRRFSTTTLRNYKVCCVGAAGGIGQPLSLLLKLNPCITRLALYDVINTAGVCVDLSHIETKCPVKAEPELECAIENSDIIVIPAGVPRKPGMTRDDLFDVNCKIMELIATAISKSSPKALIAIITNPVNSIVPLAAEVLKKEGTYDKCRLFGVTTLDLVRARTFIGEILDINPCKVDLPIIGGHAGATILPIISQCKPPVKIPDDDLKNLVKRIQNAGTEVVEAKDGTGSATLSMAYAAASFVNILICGLNGDKNVQTYAYVDCDVTEASFFSTLIDFGKNGIQNIHALPKLNDSEKEQVKTAVTQLKAEIQKGIDFSKKPKS